jgi:hypothetical protein
MTVEEVRKLHRSEPFHPFCIQLADGRSFDVNLPESLAINARRRFIAVAHQGTFDIINLSIVTSLELMKDAVSTRRRKT